MKKYLYIIVMLFISYDEDIDEKDLVKMFESNKKEQIISATKYVSNHRDTRMIKYLMADGMDPRISHSLRYKGMSIYQLKMGAMQKITGINSKRKITYQPDSMVYKFYLEISKKMIG